MTTYPVDGTMHNGSYPWVTPSSLGQKSWPPGYQASLTDLFLKKNPLHFGTGISQLAAASSYIEKMSSLNDHVQKCPHPDAKDKPHPCEVCQQYFSIYNTLKSDGACSSNINYSGGGASNVNRPMSAPPERKQLQTFPQPPTPGSVGQNHPLDQEQALPPPHPLQDRPLNINDPLPMGNQSLRRPRLAATKQFMCPVCYKYFTQKGNLKTHMMIHTGEKPYSCQVCGKSFTQKGNVDTHMKIHTGEKDFGCDICGKRFTQKGNLKTHIRSVHTKEKPFACRVCGKCFSQKGNMQTHMRTHNKDDRFPCTLCGKTFSQKGNLKTHMQRHTGQVTSRRFESQVGSHPCATAPQRSSDSSGATSFAPYRLHKSPTDPRVCAPSPLSSSPSNQPSESHGQASRNIQSPPPQILKPVPESHLHMRTSPLSQMSSGAQNSPLSQISHGAPPSLGTHSLMDQKLSTMPQHPGLSSPSPPDIMNQPPAHLHKPSVHSHQHMSTPLQGDTIPSVMHSPSPHPRMSPVNSPSPHGPFGQLAISESEGRPFYSAPPTPVQASFAHSPRWLSHGYQRHYNSFQPPSTMGSYGPITQHPTPLSRLALLSSNAMAHHHQFSSSSPEEKQNFSTNLAHNQQLESHYHQSAAPDFSQLVD
ncbi:zinc finger protein 85-like [Limulus polyphemus]|uniref:Zinc finger protein 85-like n=1 Tax=Limulus polyphemus TaxID=6850 RepID=A0ABM1THM3_LIMPO|nr:zinc finger protein 85-like [Limulus polyphemus]XP_022255379.1 zinc finger protein 85-like [Limulus polyphemus]